MMTGGNATLYGPVSVIQNKLRLLLKNRSTVVSCWQSVVWDLSMVVYRVLPIVYRHCRSSIIYSISFGPSSIVCVCPWWDAVCSVNRHSVVGRLPSLEGRVVLTKQAEVPRSFLHWSSRERSLPGSTRGRDSSS